MRAGAAAVSSFMSDRGAFSWVLMRLGYPPAYRTVWEVPLEVFAAWEYLDTALSRIGQPVN